MNNSFEFDELSNHSDANEEDLLQDELEEIELGKLISAKSKLEYKEKISKDTTKPKDTKKLREKFENLNKQKLKHEPKEFSALVKPKYKVPEIKEEKRYFRDPRFDDLSGKLKESSFKKNFSFVEKEAEQYLNKIDKIKKEKKKKFTETEYQLIKKQTNFVKGWKKSQEHQNIKDSIKTEINRENKERMQKGKKPVYLKDKLFKKIVIKEKMDKRTVKPEEMAKFLKRKKHKEIVKIKKNELRL